MRFRDLKGDLFGGLSAAIIALPLAIAFGVLTFQPLGPEWVSRGAMAGLSGAVFAGLFAALLGGTPTQVTGPTGPMTVVMASVVAGLAAHPHISSDGARGEIVLSLVFLCVFLGGAGQLLFSALGVGRLIKYIPYPVIAGFMNGIAVIILTGQVGAILGLPTSQPPTLDQVQPATAVVGLFTIAVVWYTPRFSRAIPGSLAGLALGTAAYYLVSAFIEGARLGSIIGEIPAGVPLPTYLPRFAGLMFGGGVERDVLWSLAAPALTLAVLGSIDSLLTSLVADTVTRTRHDSNRELLGQGLGNMVAASFGGLAGAGATVRTLVNISAGGRTRLSGVVHSLVLLLVLVVLGPLAGRIPMVVLAGILIVTAIKMIDEWSKSLFLKLTGTAQQKREIVINLFVVLVVTVVTVVVDLMVAVAVGVALACFLFVEKMSGSVIRRVTHGDQMRSRRVRTPEETGFLDRAGRTVVVFELQGPLFFASADQVAAAVEREAGNTRFVILDMRTVNEIDSSAARILVLMAETLQDQGKALILSYLNPSRARYGFLQDMGVIAQVGRDHVFVDTDAALEWVEERLLEEEGHEADDIEIPLESMAIVADLTAAELDQLRPLLERRCVDKGEMILRKGEPGEEMFILCKGRASTYARDETVDHLVRLATFPPGTVFGEIALLLDQPRSADVVADDDVVLYVLARDDFERLRSEHHSIAVHLLWNIGRELSSRLVTTSRLALSLEGAIP